MMKLRFPLLLILVGTCFGHAQEPLVLPNVQLFLISDVEVPAREAGVLEQVNVQPGDVLAKGQLIGMLDASLAVAELEVANLAAQIAELKTRENIDYAYAQKTWEVSQSQLELSRKANDIYENAVSQTEIQKLTLEVDRAALSMKQASRDQQEAELSKQLKDREASLAAERLERRKILAPFDGVVVKVFKQSSEWLSPGDSVVRFIRLDKLRAEVYVDAELASSDLKGKAAKFRLTSRPADDGPFTGAVVFVDPEIQPVSNQVRIWVEIDNASGKLRPGDKGDITLLASGEGELSTVPPQ